MMARLTEEMVIARSRQSDLSAIKKLNCWGGEYSDVSVLRKMPNVEVLALSINKIRTLNDFTGCCRLRELYIRKNEIRDLAEIRHLRHLPELCNLWLDENPCTQHPEYRMTVLRNLPNLEKLDDVPVKPEEIQEAMRRGHHIPDSDDEGYGQGAEWRPRSADSSPERERGYYRQQECPASPIRREAPEPQIPSRPQSERIPSSESALRHSVSAQSVKEYSYTNGVTSPHYHDPYSERQDTYQRCESYRELPRCAGECERDNNRELRERERDRDSAREYRSAVMAEHRGFTRRPVTRNSNLLSAVLCLVKELDYNSLEVAEMAVRCRMDELANSQ